jgi:hypothetical protein
LGGMIIFDGNDPVVPDPGAMRDVSESLSCPVFPSTSPSPHSALLNRSTGERPTSYVDGSKAIIIKREMTRGGNKSNQTKASRTPRAIVFPRSQFAKSKCPKRQTSITRTRKCSSHTPKRTKLQCCLESNRQGRVLVNGSTGLYPGVKWRAKILSKIVTPYKDWRIESTVESRAQYVFASPQSSTKFYPRMAVAAWASPAQGNRSIIIDC